MSPTGGAGASARREAGRWRRRARVRRSFGVLLVIGGVAGLIGSSGRPRVAAVAVAVAVGAVIVAWPGRRAGRWAAGAAGERRTAEALHGVEREGWAVLHDVRLRGRRWNLDHVLVGPGGVVVVETKQWRTPVRALRRHPRIVEERVGWQVDALRTATGGRVAVHGFLCVHGAPVRRWRFTGARWAPVGDGRHLRRWLRRLPPTKAAGFRPEMVFEPAA